MKQRRIITQMKLTAISLACGCQSRGKAAPIQAEIAIDVSCHAQARLVRLANWAYRYQRGLPEDSKLNVYEFANDEAPIYAGSALKGKDLYIRKVASQLASPPVTISKQGTKVDTVLSQFAHDANESRLPVLALICTDGGVEDLSPAAVKRIRASVHLLSMCPRLQSLAVVGVTTEYRNQWSAWLEPLGLRAIVRGDADVDEALSEVSK